MSCRAIASSKGVSALVVGSGGREHSLVWRLSQSDLCKHVYAAPGNPGTSGEKNVTNVKINIENHAEVFMAIICIAHNGWPPMCLHHCMSASVRHA